MSITSPQYQQYIEQLENMLNQKAVAVQNQNLPAKIDSFKNIIEENKTTLSQFAGIEGELMLALKENTDIESLKNQVIQELPLLQELGKKMAKAQKATLISKKDKKKLTGLVKEMSIYLKLENASTYKQKLSNLIKEINEKQQKMLGLLIKLILITAIGATAVVFISKYWHIVLGTMLVVTVFWIWRTLRSVNNESEKPPFDENTA